jgi:hypothetical protein
VAEKLTIIGRSKKRTKSVEIDIPEIRIEIPDGQDVASEVVKTHVAKTIIALNFTGRPWHGLGKWLSPLIRIVKKDTFRLPWSGPMQRLARHTKILTADPKTIDKALKRVAKRIVRVS